MNKMYEYLLDHNYISENKKSNYQSELSIERAECIANKYDYLITELKQALNEIREYTALDYSYTHVTDCDWLFKDETEEWEEYMLENYLEDDLSEEEAEKKIQEELNNMKWKKGIFIYVCSL